MTKSMIESLIDATLPELRERIAVLQAQVARYETAPRAERLLSLPSILVELFYAELIEAQTILRAEQDGQHIEPRAGVNLGLLAMLRGKK